MSRVVDDRVVELQFNNQQFERNVSQSMSTLDKLKQKLNLSGAAKGFEQIDASAKKVNMSALGSAVEAVSMKFSALQVAGVTALVNITNQAMHTAKNMVSALTIDPVGTGFQEYETQIGAIQTILANTKSKGSTLQDVNRALAELNTYADKTIYNFTEMTKNIGTFTAAGVDLEKSVSSIKGIANLAAVSGSTSQQASTAMYQLSQALAAGRVSLMDWNSVVNAGMGGELFQTALKRTAEHMGKNVDAAIEKYGSFRESLTQGEWLTTEVLTETLTQLSGAYTEADLIAQGYTEDQAKQIAQLAETAVSAATEVKTFTQLWDTLKEAAQSGWTQSWQTMIGDFDEAKNLLTGISNSVGGYINSVSEARNKVLTEGLSTGWKQLLGQGLDMDEDRFKESIKSTARDHGIAIDEMIEKQGSFDAVIKSGAITGDILEESLDKMTQAISNMSEEELKANGYTTEQIKTLNKLNQAVKDGSVSMDDFAKKMTMDSGRENVIQGLANIFQALGNVIKPVKEAFRDIFPATTGEQLYKFTENFENLTEKLTKKFEATGDTVNNLKRTFTGLFSVFDLVGKGIKAVLAPLGEFATGGGLGSVVDIFLGITAAIGDFFTTLNQSAGAGNFFKGIAEGLTNTVRGISAILQNLTGIDTFGDAFSKIGDVIGKTIGKIGDAIKWLSDNLSMGDIFAGLAGGGIFMVARKLSGILKTVKESIDDFFGKGVDKAVGIGKNISMIFEGLHESISAFTTGIKAGTLLTIAAAIGILSMSLKSLSELKLGELGMSLMAIGSLMTMLNLSFRSITKSLSKFDSAGIVKAGLSLIAMATAINIFASAMEKIAGLSIGEVAKGLIGLGVGLKILTNSLKAIDKSNVSLKTSVAILAIAQACKMLADALAQFGSMSLEEIGKGLGAMAGALAELSLTTIALNKFSGGKSLVGSASILILVQTLGTIADALQQLGTMSWDDLGKSLAGMGLALGELLVITGFLNLFSGGKSLVGSASILLLVQSLDEISENLKRLGSMSWEGIAKGLVAMGVALVELSVTAGVLGKLAGFSGLLGAGTILLAVQSLEPIANALQKIGTMPWEEIGRGLAGMAGAFTVLGAASFLTGLAGFTGVLGAGTLDLAVQSLDKLANGLQKFGTMSWEEIGHGLVAMGGALAELGTASFLTGLGGLSSIVGAGSLTMAVQGLDELANALQKFGSMSWDEIERGLVAMAGALGETALGGIANTFSFLGAGSISTIAEPLGLLADSVKKWSGVTVPEDLGTNLGILASGINRLMFSGFGADTIATVAEPLGVMAESVKKWAGVTVPEGLGEQMSSLAKGINEFWLGGIGSGALASSAEPLGQMADAVKKWADVTITESLTTGLENLAKGVKEFSFAFAGGWSIGEVVGPLGEMADSIKKFADVTIPEGIADGLGEVAKGVKEFGTAFLGGWSIGAVVGPLGQLADAIKKFAEVTIPEGIATSLGNVADGVRKFSGITAENIPTIAQGIQGIGTAAQSIAAVDLAGIATKLSTFATSISTITADTSGLTSLVSSLQAAASQLSTVGASIVSNLIGGIASQTGALQAAVTGLVNTIPSAASASAGALTAIGASIAGSLIVGVTGRMGEFMLTATLLMTQFISGIESAKAGVSNAFTGGLSAAVSAISGYYESFYSAGASISQGLADGIQSGVWAAQQAAIQLAEAAAIATRAKLEINSPSKVFRAIGTSVPEGFAQGIAMFGGMIKRSTSKMANTALNSTKRSMDTLSTILSSDIDYQPSICPVMDLSNVRSGMKTIDGLLNNGPTMAVSANLKSIGSLTNNRNQNGANDDVVNAIDKLRKALGDVGGNTTYNVNGVTYDDGSNVTEAVKALVRAAKVERRV